MFENRVTDISIDGITLAMAMQLDAVGRHIDIMPLVCSSGKTLTPGLASF
jgi:hypothetical protein